MQTLSRAMDSAVVRQRVDLTLIARSVTRRLRKRQSERKVTFSIAKGMVVEGSPELLGVMVDELLDNAWKFTEKRPSARVEMGVTDRDGKQAYYVRDDGAGFDMSGADRLFGLFQRLHPANEFEGEGVGLAVVRHIVHRHGGEVAAEGEVDKGATFYFSLQGDAAVVVRVRAE